jgi:amino acid permease
MKLKNRSCLNKKIIAGLYLFPLAFLLFFALGLLINIAGFIIFIKVLGIVLIGCICFYAAVRGIGILEEIDKR